MQKAPHLFYLVRFSHIAFGLDINIFWELAIRILQSDEQSSKSENSSEVIPGGRVIFESEVQHSKADDSIELTEEGIEISFNEVHFSNADDPIDAIDGGCFISVGDVFHSNGKFIFSIFDAKFI